jgi:hypothetical protein
MQEKKAGFYLHYPTRTRAPFGGAQKKEKEKSGVGRIRIWVKTREAT